MAMAKASSNNICGEDTEDLYLSLTSNLIEAVDQIWGKRAFIAVCIF